MRALKAFAFAPFLPIFAYIAFVLVRFLFSDHPQDWALFGFQMLALFWIGFLVSVVILGAMGLPVFIVLRTLGVVNPFVTIALAAVMGASIEWLPEANRLLKDSNSLTYFRIGDCVSVVDGIRTACGWGLFAQRLVLYGMLGALAGASFWFTYQNHEKFSLKWAGSALFALAAIYAAAVVVGRP